MNCKPGDLAVTHSAPMDNGFIVEVGEGMEHPRVGQCWFVTSQGSPFHFEPGVLRRTVLWPDALLRPIRDPGEDAQDESLTWLPSPSRTTEAA